MKKGFVSIIIPSYNEASNIKLIYESLRNEFQSIDYDYEIYYINDGLRMLRALRFMSQLEFELSPNTKKAICENRYAEKSGKRRGRTPGEI